MKLYDLVTPDELERELFDSGSKVIINEKLDAAMRDWKPFADMFSQRVLLGDCPQVGFLFWMTIIAAIGNILAEKEQRQVQ
jgi:hypothetical protein